jgi:hypothetical protein
MENRLKNILYHAKLKAVEDFDLKDVSLNQHFFDDLREQESILIQADIIHPLIKRVYVEKEASDQGLNTTFLNQLIK